MRIHSLVTAACEVRSSVVAGKGLFATAPIAQGEIVAVMGGKIYTSAELEQLARSFPHVQANSFGVAPGMSLGSENLFEDDDSELFNHSCDANCGVVGQIIIVARRDIAPNDELTLDYDTFELHPAPFACQCNSPRCRGTVLTGTAWQDAEFVSQNRAYLSWYVAEHIRKHAEHHG